MWLTRNLSIIEGNKIDVETTFHRILAQMHTFPLISKKKRARKVGALPILIYPHGFFGRGTNHKIGIAGIFLGLGQSHSFCIKLGCGFSTISRAEL